MGRSIPIRATTPSITESSPGSTSGRSADRGRRPRGAAARRAATPAVAGLTPGPHRRPENRQALHDRRGAAMLHLQAKITDGRFVTAAVEVPVWHDMFVE